MGAPGLYLSQVLGRPVLDAQGGRLATIRDVIIRFGSEPHPPISGLVARQSRRDFYLDAGQIQDISVGGARLRTFTVNLQPFERREGEVLLRRDVLDKQLIDVDGHRVVRANDLELTLVDGRYRLMAVDVSAQGLLRRLGPAGLAARFEGRRLIDWEDVESFATDVPMVRLRSPHDRVARLHPVEIAHLVEGLSLRQGQEILASLDDETAADTVQELTAERAADHLSALDRERAADILEAMDPNDAADVLADLPPEDAEALLGLMEPDESEDVRELLTYDEDSAAGLMTTDFVTLSADLTAAEAIARLRSLEEPPDPLAHVSAVPSATSGQLVGSIDLRDLVLAAPETPLRQLCEPDRPVARADESAREVAYRMAEYDLSDVAVLDAAGQILGVVLIDDAIEVLCPDVERRRRRFRQ
ncbi:MAG: magnesium transporter [Chloroflexi bacterium]|nr:magnesium transporter [Chloroflexota bacterium]